MDGAGLRGAGGLSAFPLCARSTVQTLEAVPLFPAAIWTVFQGHTGTFSEAFAKSTIKTLSIGFSCRVFGASGGGAPLDSLWRRTKPALGLLGEVQLEPSVAKLLLSGLTCRRKAARGEGMTSAGIFLTAIPWLGGLVLTEFPEPDGGLKQPGWLFLFPGHGPDTFTE